MVSGLHKVLLGLHLVPDSGGLGRGDMRLSGGWLESTRGPDSLRSEMRQMKV